MPSPEKANEEDEVVATNSLWGAHACSVLVAAFCGDELPILRSIASNPTQFARLWSNKVREGKMPSPARYKRALPGKMIALENVTKSYGRKRVLRGISFEAQAGEITLVVGPNAAGKSTTVKILAGLVRLDDGNAWINSFDVVRDRINAQRALAYLPQNPNFHPRLTCSEILRFYARLRGLTPARCDAMLDLGGLREFTHVRTGKLSGGMRQRLGIALLLLPDAPVLLLDEPGLSLDPGWRKRLQEILHTAARDGKTVLITTHLIAEWNNVADRCLLCRDGKIERELDPTNLPHDFDETSTFVAASSTDSRKLSELCEASGAIAPFAERPLREALHERRSA